MINDVNNIAVLSVDAGEENQIALAKILPDVKVYCCSRPDSALAMVRKHRIPVVFCDSDADWRGLLDQLRGLPHPPFLIVTSRLADDRLWSEALNLGAYDVLAKPFDPTEVTRVLTMAWIRWVESATRPLHRTRPKPLTQPAYA